MSTGSKLLKGNQLFKKILNKMGKYVQPGIGYPILIACNRCLDRETI